MTNGANTRFPMTPARWLTLALGVPVLLAMIGGIGFSAVANIGAGSFKVRQTIPLNGTRLTAQINGDVTLRRVAVRGAEFTGTAHYSLIRARVTATGDTVRFHCPLAVGNCALNGTLQIPDSTASVSLSTGGGDVNVPDFSGQSLTLNTDGGNVMLTLPKSCAHYDIVTNPAGGNVNISPSLPVGSSNKITVDSSGGDITINAAS